MAQEGNSGSILAYKFETIHIKEDSIISITSDTQIRVIRNMSHEESSITIISGSMSFLNNKTKYLFIAICIIILAMLYMQKNINNEKKYQDDNTSLPYDKPQNKIETKKKQSINIKYKNSFLDKKTNEEFIQNILLKNLKKIIKIKISYKNNYGNKKAKSIKINRIVLNDKIIFSELKQDTFISKIFLKNAKSINLISIEYLDKNNNNAHKTINIKNKYIKNNNLYIYENNNYIYKNTRSIKKSLSKPKKAVFKKNIEKTRIYKKIFSSKNSLNMAYFDNNNYVDIIIKQCNKINYFCNDAKFRKLTTKAIFYIPFKVKNTKKTNLSKHIKRIQIAYDTTRKSPTWLVIEGFSKINKIKKMYYQNNKLTFEKPSSLDAKKIQLAYRMYFE